MEDLIQDLRLVLRVMRRNKGFAAATLLTLALGGRRAASADPAEALRCE
jgi:hypothetical protein